MGLTFKEYCLQLEADIEVSYQSGVTASKAEELAGKFLGAQLSVSRELAKADLEARMRKTGLKAIRAAAYMDAATKDPKKPSDTMLENIVARNDYVGVEQQKYDEAEVLKAELERYYNVFAQAHIHFRTIAKGVFGG